MSDDIYRNLRDEFERSIREINTESIIDYLRDLVSEKNSSFKKQKVINKIIEQIDKTRATNLDKILASLFLSYKLDEKLSKFRKQLHKLSFKQHSLESSFEVYKTQIENYLNKKHLFSPEEVRDIQRLMAQEYKQLKSTDALIQVAFDKLDQVEAKQKELLRNSIKCAAIIAALAMFAIYIAAIYVRSLYIQKQIEAKLNEKEQSTKQKQKNRTS